MKSKNCNDYDGLFTNGRKGRNKKILKGIRLNDGKYAKYVTPEGGESVFRDELYKEFKNSDFRDDFLSEYNKHPDNYNPAILTRYLRTEFLIKQLKRNNFFIWVFGLPVLSNRLTKDAVSTILWSNPQLYLPILLKKRTFGRNYGKLFSDEDWMQLYARRREFPEKLQIKIDKACGRLDSLVMQSNQKKQVKQEKIGPKLKKIRQPVSSPRQKKKLPAKPSRQPMKLVKIVTRFMSKRFGLWRKLMQWSVLSKLKKPIEPVVARPSVQAPPPEALENFSELNGLHSSTENYSDLNGLNSETAISGLSGLNSSTLPGSPVKKSSSGLSALDSSFEKKSPEDSFTDFNESKLFPKVDVRELSQRISPPASPQQKVVPPKIDLSLEGLNSSTQESNPPSPAQVNESGQKKEFAENVSFNVPGVSPIKKSRVRSNVWGDNLAVTLFKNNNVKTKIPSNNEGAGNKNNNSLEGLNSSNEEVVDNSVKLELFEQKNKSAQSEEVDSLLVLNSSF